MALMSTWCFILVVWCFQQSSAIMCNYEQGPGTISALTVHCNQNPLTVTRLIDLTFDEIRLDVLCSNNYSHIFIDYSAGFETIPGTASYLVSDLASGMECTYFGCVRDSNFEYRFINVTCPGRAMMSSSAYPTSGLGLVEGSPTTTALTTALTTTVTTAPVSALVSKLVSASAGTVSPSATPSGAAQIGNQGSSLLVTVVPATITFILVCVVFNIVLCFLFYRRKSVKLARRSCQLESLYKYEEVDMDDTFITSIGFCTRSPSTPSVLTLLDTLVHTNSKPSGSQIGASEVRMQSPFSEGPGDDDKMIWSDLELCFLDSESESVEADGDSMQYFKAENLKSCQVGMKSFGEGVVHWSTGRDDFTEGNGWSGLLQEGRMESATRDSRESDMNDNERNSNESAGRNSVSTNSRDCKDESNEAVESEDEGLSPDQTSSSLIENADTSAADDSGFNSTDGHNTL